SVTETSSRRTYGTSLRAAVNSSPVAACRGTVSSTSLNHLSQTAASSDDPAAYAAAAISSQTHCRPSPSVARARSEASTAAPRTSLAVQPRAYQKPGTSARPGRGGTSSGGASKQRRAAPQASHGGAESPSRRGFSWPHSGQAQAPPTTAAASVMAATLGVRGERSLAVRAYGRARPWDAADPTYDARDACTERARARPRAGHDA